MRQVNLLLPETLQQICVGHLTVGFGSTPVPDAKNIAPIMENLLIIIQEQNIFLKLFLMRDSWEYLKLC
jgi:hypothetical protein